MTTVAGTIYHADLSELIEDSIPDSPLEDRHDILCKIVERILDPMSAAEKKRILGDLYPNVKTRRTEAAT